MQSSTLSDVILTGIYFGLSMFGAGFCLGVFRVLLVVPMIGELPAVLMELPLIMMACWRLSKLFIQNVSNGVVAMGVVAFATLLLFEVALSLLVFDKALDEILQDFASTKGIIGILGQVTASSFPAIQLRMKRKQRLK